MRVMTIFGTRPEAIKLAPVILKAQRDESFDIRVCVTGQHDEMLKQVLDFFGITPDHDLEIMQPNQSLYDVTADIVKALENVIVSEDPSLVLVQGDTTTAFVGTLCAFYKKVPIAHIEAGLRSHNKYSPFPEEINRVLVGQIADYHFAPTVRAKENLLREGVKEDRVYVVGNTVIDALYLTLDKIKDQENGLSKYFDFLDQDKRLILVTGHRRESFGEPLRNICMALRKIAEDNHVEIVYPVHLNPNVRKLVFEILNGPKNVHLIDPLDYPHLIWLMKRSYLIITDSGGIQEEAPGLGKPVLVIRDVTERVEGIEAGTCKLVGTRREKIVDETFRLLSDFREYERMAKAVNPYGDGKSSDRILSIIKGVLC
ncbi:MAG: UDP-N-acetylglucosamine 2-epimerase (non-hydrolyzing) [Thermodesulfobacteriota bacterium]|jgi:UDP-N-acetylglucosamine 2-epimerase (non-hydrolysing)